MEKYRGDTPLSPLVVCNAKRSEEHLIAKFSQLVKMK